jgi:predicted dehydrogenase
MDRRSFIKLTSTAAATATFGAIPSLGLAQEQAAQPAAAQPTANGQKLRVAGIGVGGMGGSDISQIASHPEVKIVALCDVDRSRIADAKSRFPEAAEFTDFRELFEKMGDEIDAVHVSTPDHTHAPASMTALNLGKHVYCQKPLTHDIYEARQLAKIAAANSKLATQMGTQNASRVPKRQALALLRDSSMRNETVGRVLAVYGWSDRPAGWWPQGNQRPQGEDTVPDVLEWDLWIGTAPMRPYKKDQYAPFNWRGTYDFGCGALGDMACHIMDTAYYGLELGHAKSVVSHSEDSTDDQFPTVQHAVLVFAGSEASGGQDIGWYWFDGGAIPHLKALRMPGHVNLPSNGSVVVGDRGSLLITHEGDQPRWFDKNAEKDLAAMLPKLEPRNHYHHWVDACLGRGQTECRFEISGPLTEQLCLGAISARFPHQTLQWDGESMKFVNSEEANKLVRRKYREGFEVENL